MPATVQKITPAANPPRVVMDQTPHNRHGNRIDIYQKQPPAKAYRYMAGR